MFLQWTVSFSVGGVVGGQLWGNPLSLFRMLGNNRETFLGHKLLHYVTDTLWPALNITVWLTTYTKTENCWKDKSFGNPTSECRGRADSGCSVWPISGLQWFYLLVSDRCVRYLNRRVTKKTGQHAAAFLVPLTYFDHRDAKMTVPTLNKLNWAKSDCLVEMRLNIVTCLYICYSVDPYLKPHKTHCGDSSRIQKIQSSNLDLVLEERTIL